MKSIIRILASTAMIASSFAVSEGLWGGKWDDTWPVFIEVQRNGSAYEVRYFWLENMSNSDISSRTLAGRKRNGYMEADFLSFKLTGDTGMLYGAFGNPRAANLVKIQGAVPKPDDCDMVLRQHGWREGAVPPEEALKKIKGK